MGSVVTPLVKDVIVIKVSSHGDINIAFLAHPFYILINSHQPQIPTQAESPPQPRSPIPTTSAQFPRPSRRIHRRLLILNQRLQQPPHLPTPRTRRIIVDREHANRAEASGTNHGRLAGQGAVAVDARVGAGGDDGAVAEQAGSGVVDGGVDVGAAGHAGLYEGRSDAVGVFKGGDFGVVDAEAVAEGQELGFVGVLGELVHEGD